MQFNIIFKTIFEYFHQIFRFMHTNTVCKYRKKLLASPRVHLVLYIELLLMYPQTIRTCPSSVEITLERGYTISTMLNVLKFGQNINIGVMHVWKKVWFRNSNYKLQIYAIYDYLQIVLCSRFSLIYWFDFAENWFTCTLHDYACLK